MSQTPKRKVKSLPEEEIQCTGWRESLQNYCPPTFDLLHTPMQR